MKRICAVIPALNEARHIEPILSAIAAQVDNVLVVDDGSTDNTGAIARAAGVDLLVHAENRGKGESLRDGLDWALEQGYGAALALDSDGQHLPEEAPPFLAAWEAGAELVVGNRMHDTTGMPTIRRWTNRFMSGVVSRLAHTAIPDSQCGYRLISTPCWEAIRPRIHTTGFDFESDMLIESGRLGWRVAAVPISTIYGEEKSKIRPIPDTIRFFRMVWRKLWDEEPREPHAHTP